MSEEVGPRFRCKVCGALDITAGRDQGSTCQNCRSGKPRPASRPRPAVATISLPPPPPPKKAAPKPIVPKRTKAERARARALAAAQQQADAERDRQIREERWRQWLGDGGVAGPRTALGLEHRRAVSEYQALRKQVQELEQRLGLARSELRSARDHVQAVSAKVEREAWQQSRVSRPATLAQTSSSPTPEQLRWQVLPAGGLTILARRLVMRDGGNSSANGRFEPGRLYYLNSLKPKNWYEGSHLGRTVYLVAIFDRVAIADSPDWGNALYWCPVANWQSVFRMEKREARAAGAKRIYHTDGWEIRLRTLLAGGAGR